MYISFASDWIQYKDNHYRSGIDPKPLQSPNTANLSQQKQKAATDQTSTFPSHHHPHHPHHHHHHSNNNNTSTTTTTPPNTTNSKISASPSRFSRDEMTWHADKESTDVVAFEVDRVGVEVVGVAIYTSDSCITTVPYELELLEKQGVSGDRWVCLEALRGVYNNRPFEAHHTVQVLFHRPLSLQVSS